MNRQKLHPPEAAAHYRKSFRNNVIKGFTTSTEAELVRKDGSHVLADLSAVKLVLGGREVMQGIFQDATARRQAERLLQDIIDKNPLSIQIIDKDGFTLKTNLVHNQIFGSVPPPEYSIFRDPQLKKLGFAKLFARAKNGEVVNLPDVPYNAHDTAPSVPDKPIWLRAVMFPLFDGAGKPNRFVLMHEDITRRKLAEDQLKETTLFNKSVIDNAQDGIVVINRDMRYTLFSPFAEKLFGKA